MRRRSVCLTLLSLVAAAAGQEECTVAVISGKATLDGRPLLWKNRDSSKRENEVAFFRGSRYDFLGVINAGDTTQVWMGVNSAGLAIMNSESMDQPGDSADTEGFFMKHALAVCGNLTDFETLLNQTNNAPRGTRANFGCIDAFGGAAFFETGNRGYVRFNVDDEKTGRIGFLVRANFSMTGTQQEGYGSWRYHRGRTLLQDKARQGLLTYEYLIRNVSRDLATDEVDPYPLPFTGAIDGAAKGWMSTQNSINRHRTVSGAVFHGVKPGESPVLTTFWCLLGEPICTIAVPLWAAAGPVSDLLDGAKTSWLNSIFQHRHDQLYSDKNRPTFLDTNQLVGTRSFIARLNRIEGDILKDTEQALQRWRAVMPSGEVMAAFQNEQLKYVVRRYQ